MSGEGSETLCARLRAIGAENALEALQRECVDLDALSLLGEEELREIGVPLGPRVKILHSGLARTQRRDRADSEAAREIRAWDMEAMTDVEALQQAARPRMCLNVQSGRVTRLAFGIRNAGILANEDDLPFVVLMGQVWPARCHLIRVSTLREVGVLSSPNSAVHSALLIVRAREHRRTKARSICRLKESSWKKWSCRRLQPPAPRPSCPRSPTLRLCNVLHRIWLSCGERFARAHVDVRCGLVEGVTAHGAGANGTADVAA